MSEIIEGTVKVIVDACFKAGYDKGYQQGRADAIDEVYNIVTDFLINSNSELDFNLALQNKILDLKYK